MNDMDNIFIWAGRPFVSLPDYQSAIAEARKEGVLEGIRIATSVPIEEVPAAIAALPAAEPAEDVRAGALREAAALFNGWWICAPDGSDLTEDVQAAILALIPEAKP